MHIDLSVGTPPDRIDADLAIIGAGAAGLTIARALAGSGIRIALIESGPFESHPPTQNLYEGTSGPQLPYWPFYSRLRYFGGSTNHWEGWCGIMAEETFKPRPWVPHSGWPIPRTELLPWWKAGHEVLELGDFNYTPPERAKTPSPALFAGGKSVFTPYLFRLSPPTRMGQKYRDAVVNAPNITVITRANVMPIAAPKGDRLSELELKSLEGVTTRVRADYFILACGGIENPRLLLASGNRAAGGLANSSGLVGRYFMEHWAFPFRAIIRTAGGWWEAFNWVKSGDVSTPPALALSYEAQEYFKLLQVVVGAGAKPMTPPEGVRVGDDVCLQFSMGGEQAPNPDSRVMLGTELDPLGVPRVHIDWRITEVEKETARQAVYFYARMLGEAGLGRMKLMPDRFDDVWPNLVSGASHHMGTTRMSEDPAQGVVNTDCRSHDIKNLYIAGSSVFPGGDKVNPTLTIVALALRLTEHLKSVMG